MTSAATKKERAPKKSTREGMKQFVTWIPEDWYEEISDIRFGHRFSTEQQAGREIIRAGIDLMKHKKRSP